MSKNAEEPCLCCGYKTNKKILMFKVADVFICESSCVFSKPKINTNSMYTPDYFKNFYENDNVEQSLVSKNLATLLKKYIQTGSILDYGCGIGTFLSDAQKKGFTENVGIDVSEYSISKAKNKTPECEFYTNDTLIGSKKFDCISFIDSLAHVHDINSTFSKVLTNNLNKEGIVLIRTPNINRYYIFYIRCLNYFLPRTYINSLFFIPTRLFLFNSKSIVLFLKKHGLDIKEYLFESEHKKVTTKEIKKMHLKGFIKYFFWVLIPSLINPKNSITIISKLKK